MTQTPERRKEWRRERRQRDPEAFNAAERERRKRYGRACLDCGTITDGSNGYDKAPERCSPCSNRHRMTWTPAMIIEAIRLFERRYGHPPAAWDWNPALARRYGRDDFADRFYRDGDYPPVSACQREFGSWSNAIEAAGFTPRGVGQHGQRRPRV